MGPKPAPKTPKSQRTIASYFSPQEGKRKGGEEENTDPMTTPAKKAKTEDPPKTPKQEEPQSARSSLTPEQKDRMKMKQATAMIKRLSHEFTLVNEGCIGTSWFTELLEQEFKKPYFKTLDNFYASASNRATVYPPKDQIFSWTQHCEIRDVKVVIIGQDPYHGPRQAHGLCFSVQKGVPTPPSLLNMYKELVDDPGVPEFTKIPSHGHLVGWATQGVLLLNAVLTVEASKANSHKDKGWEQLTTSAIKWISCNLRNVVFLLWGANAQKISVAAGLDKKRHSVLECTHPSPLSAHRGFFGCRHFSKCNELLVNYGKNPIKWEQLP